MKYSGKQIRITLKTGEVKVYRGSAYSLRIYVSETSENMNFNSVQIFFCGKDLEWWYFSEVEKVVEDQFLSEEIK